MNNFIKKIKRKLYIFFGLFALLFLTPNIKLVNAQGSSWYSGVGDVVLQALISSMDFVFGNIFQFIGWVIQLGAGLFASLGGQFLDFAIEFSLQTENLKLAGISNGWEIFRDLTNMLFIFILLYIAIMTILQTSNFNTKKILSSLIIVGLLVNFSFFLTGAVIDVGNITGGIIYNAVSPVDVNGDRIGIGGKFIEGLQLSKLLDKVDTGGVSNFGMGFLHLLNALFLFVAGFTFISGAILFVLRQITLIFVLVLSPLAFAATILPATKKHWDTWLNKLIGSTFVAPIYLLLIAVVLAIINAGDLLIKTGGSDQSFNAVNLTGSPNAEIGDFGGIILNYAVLIGLILASTVIARNMAEGIANTSTKFAGKLVGVGIGGAAFAGRHTIGRGLNAIRQNPKLQKLTEKEGFGGFGARMALRTANYGAGASFDARSGTVGKAFGGTVGATLGVVGIDTKTGKAGGKGGYKKRLDEMSKREVKFAKSFGVDENEVARLKSKSEHEKIYLEELKSRKAHKSIVDAQQKKVNESQKKIAEEKTNRQRKHAERLQKRGHWRSFATFRLKSTSKALGDAVAKDLSRDKNQKLFDEMVDLSKKISDSDDKKKSDT